MKPKPHQIIYFDQNAWIALAQGASNKIKYPDQHAALAKVIDALKAERIIVPLSFSNIYETLKINDPVRREHLARVQSTISNGTAFRSRRRIFEQSLIQHLCNRFAIKLEPPPVNWFLSNVFFESAEDYTPEKYGFEISENIMALIQQNPAFSLFHYLTENDETVRLESVRRFSASSAELISRIEKRRKRIANENFSIRRRAYSAELFLNELGFIFEIANKLKLGWSSVSDIGPSLAKSLINEIPVMDVERELVIRLEDQTRIITENDLRDMEAFTIALPMSNVIVAEKPFIGLVRQAGLERKYKTLLLTSVLDLTSLDF